MKFSINSDNVYAHLSSKPISQMNWNQEGKNNMQHNISYIYSYCTLYII